MSGEGQADRRVVQDQGRIVADALQAGDDAERRFRAQGGGGQLATVIGNAAFLDSLQQIPVFPNDADEDNHGADNVDIDQPPVGARGSQQVPVQDRPPFTPTGQQLQPVAGLRLGTPASSQQRLPGSSASVSQQPGLPDAASSLQGQIMPGPSASVPAEQRQEPPFASFNDPFDRGMTGMYPHMGQQGGAAAVNVGRNTPGPASAPVTTMQTSQPFTIARDNVPQTPRNAQEAPPSPAAASTAAPQGARLPLTTEGIVREGLRRRASNERQGRQPPSRPQVPEGASWHELLAAHRIWVVEMLGEEQRYTYPITDDVVAGVWLRATWSGVDELGGGHQ